MPPEAPAARELPVSSEFLNHPCSSKIEMTVFPERDLTVF